MKYESIFALVRDEWLRQLHLAGLWFGRGCVNFKLAPHQMAKHTFAQTITTLVWPNMNPARKRKMLMLLMMIGVIGIAAGLILYALRQNISLFYTPSQIAMGEAPVHHFIRAGGVVVPGSILRGAHDLSIRFKITDYKHTVDVVYQGILPDLFREGQGIVAQGQLIDNKQFQAKEVLAKHDEKYMPPEVSAALNKAKEQG